MPEAYTHLKRYERPANFADFGDVERADYYVAYGQHRDSDVLTRSNFAVMLKRLGGESETVLVLRDSHWAVGWVEAIYIRADDTAHCMRADTLLGELADYSILDESHFSELEMTEANEIWKNCYSVVERIAYIRKHRNQFEFRDYADMRACIRGDYFAGYASELVG